VRELTVEFDCRQVSLIENVAIFVVVTAAEPCLSCASGQSVRPLDIAPVAQLQNRVQPCGVKREQLGELVTPADLLSQLEIVRQTCLRGQPALQAASDPAACIVQRPGGAG